MRRIRAYLKSRRTGLFAGGLIALACGFISVTDRGELVDNLSARRIEFYVRVVLDRFPKLHDRIKIFVFDDDFIHYIDKTELSLDEWATMLEAVDRQNPSHIFIDKIFGFAPDESSEVPRFVERVGKLNSIISVGSFGSANEIPLRPPLNEIDSDHYALDIKNLSPTHPVKNLPRIDVYGPDPRLQDAFDHIGHIGYERNGVITPFLRFSKEVAVPHIGFWAAKNLDIGASGIYADGVEVPVSERGTQIINIASKGYYYSKTYGAKALYSRAKKGKEISVVNPGDVVIILPLMFTSTTDWVSTPLDDMPGGFVYTSVVNSVLNGKFIHQVEGQVIYPVIFGILGFLIAEFLSPMMFGLVSLCVGLLIAVGGIMSFVLLSVTLPWMFSLISFLGVITVGYMMRSQRERLEQIRIGAELETARLVQEMYYPPAEIRNDRVAIQGYRDSASECSGDWWYHLSREGRFEYILIVDAMGHGTPAALLTAMAYSTFQNLVQKASVPVRPSEFLASLNELTFDALKGKMLMSAWICRFNSDEASLSFASAGHPFPLLIPSGKNAEGVAKKVKTLAGGGSPIGFDRSQEFTETTVKLSNGDRLFAYTDGLLESHNPKKPDMKLKFYQKFFANTSERSVADLAKEILDQARNYHGDYLNADDVTYFVAEFMTNTSSLDKAS